MGGITRLISVSFQGGRLNCNSSGQEVEGWRVMPIPQNKINYIVEYYFSPTIDYNDLVRIHSDIPSSWIFSSESNINDYLLRDELLLNVYKFRIKAEIERRTGRSFAPGLSNGVVHNSNSNTSFHYSFEYDEFFEYHLYQGFASCSDNANVMFAAITCSAD